MRTLATIALSFAAGVFAAVLLGVGVWQLWAAGACLLVGLVLLGLKRTMPARLRLRGMLILFALCGALVYTALFQALVQTPVTARCGQMGEFSGTVLSRPVETEWGVRVTIRLSDSAAKAEVYADAEYAGLEPGQQLSGMAQWQDAARIRENDVTAFTSRGVFALLYARGPLTAEEGSAESIRWLPQRAVYALREKIAAIWPDGDTAAFVTAELTGDRSGMAEEDAAVMTQAGVAHLFAVSGLHCAFLVSLLGLLLPVRRRALGAGLSMAVLLFYMFMMGHPLEGKLEAEIKCMDIHAMNKLYGKNPIFIYDPNDKSNRPVKGYQDNVIIYWELYPQVIRDLFIKSFTVGLTAPNKRVTEKEWLEAFANLLSGIVLCPKCGAEVFFDAQKHDNGIAQTCWNCKSTVPMPATLIVGKSRVLLQKDAKLYAHHIYGNFDMNTVVGSVVQNPKNPNLWGIRNESTENWTYIKPDGMQIPVAIGKSAAIAKDVRIDFGQMTGEFK